MNDRYVRRMEAIERESLSRNIQKNFQKYLSVIKI